MRLALAPALAALALACAAGAARAEEAAGARAPGEPLKVGFVWLGPVSDHGWTHGHDRAREAVEAEFGDRVRTTVVEGVPEGPEAERVISRLARDGHRLVFANAFGHARPALRAAARSPDLRVEVATGAVSGERVALFSARFYEGRYAAGVVAAHASRTGVAGYVASLPVPEVARGINAFLLGMRSVNPEARLRVAWVHSWYDPPREAEAARVLLSQGADVLTQHTDSTAVLLAAAEEGALAFGLASDMSAFAPGAHVSSIVNHWEAHYVSRVRAALEGTWETGRFWGGLADGTLSLTPWMNVPPEAAAAGDAAVEAIASGALRIFEGPLVDQGGVLRAAPGEALDEESLLAMDWLLEGVVGSLP